jgi:hypothetical protein
MLEEEREMVGFATHPNGNYDGTVAILDLQPPPTRLRSRTISGLVAAFVEELPR